MVHPAHANEVRSFVDTQLTFFGHTHVQGGFLLTHSGSTIIPPHVPLQLEPDHFYLVNPGSVGQPRDRDPRAAYLVYDPEKKLVEFRRVSYDIETAGRKILEAGLPTSLAARLQDGR